MSKDLRFDGRVAIVTGAGNGLGRSHALLLASRGAKVVVNDLGGSFKGEGTSQSAADKVVDEIKAAGGEAVANYNSVEDGDQIVKTAIDAFGRVDIVINNAGILRDVSFQKMSPQDWDLIYRVHVLGAFRVTHAAWPYMRDQKYGRVIMTASAAGIYGNFGQANYSMAKLGVYGFGQTLSIEGRKSGILVNTIAPIAGSRMTETVLPQNLLDALKPEFVSPLVAWLCHESSEETGGLFEVGGGFFAKLRWERTEGKTFRLGRAISVEDVQRAWPAVTDFASSTHPASVAASMQPIMDNVEKGPSKGGNQFIDVDAAHGYEMPAMTSSYDERDLSLYALGVGAAANPLDDKDLRLVYEMHNDGMKALPTFGVVPAVNAVIEQYKQGQQPPGLNYGLERILHGEQYLELKRPLPTRAKLTHKGRVKDIFDKGKLAVVVTELNTYDESGNELMRNEVTLAVRGAGGWGGERGPSVEINIPPDRAPDAVVEEAIPAHQALLYRLSGDINPLHADPGFASSFGFQKPILHGLCTFGYAGRQIIQRFAKDGDPDYFKSIKVRFADSVFPGETLITEVWKESDTRVIFRCKVKERDKVVISNAAIEFYREVPKPAEKPKAAPAAAPVASAPAAAPALKSEFFFTAMHEYVSKTPDLSKIAKVYLFKLSSPASTWTLDLKSGTPSTKAGEHGKADCILELSDADFLAMSTGKANPMKLFTSGKLKISGDVMASQKLEAVMKGIDPKLVQDLIAKASGGAAAPAAAPAATPAASAELSSGDLFAVMADYVSKNPELSKTGKSFLFKLSGPASTWTLDLKSSPPFAKAGEHGKADCTLELSDADFLAMSTGKANPMKLFTSGKLKISGDVMASQKLEVVLKGIDPKKAQEAIAAARASAPKAEAAQEAPKAEAQAPKIVAALQKRFSETPALAGDVGAKIQLVITDPAARVALDFVSSPALIAEGEQAGATATLTIREADLVALIKGEQTARSLYQHGQLRVDGDVSVAHRLGFFKGLL